MKTIDDNGIEKEVISRKNAREKGLKYYFTGNSCKNGHIVERLVSNGICKTCAYKRTKEWFERNPKYSSEYDKRNPDKTYLKTKKYREANPEIFRNHCYTRKARKLLAIPKWFSKNEVLHIYKMCSKISSETSIQHHVDHIVPLKSPFVCGLHWHGNLQILTAEENVTKKNTYWPDMPDTSEPELKALAESFKIEYPEYFDGTILKQYSSTFRESINVYNDETTDQPTAAHFE